MARQPVKTPGAQSAAVAEPIPTLPDTTVEGLPNAIDVDVTSLLGPVLTRQGWVCPPPRTDAEEAALRAKLAVKG